MRHLPNNPRAQHTAGCQLYLQSKNIPASKASCFCTSHQNGAVGSHQQEHREPKNCLLRRKLICPVRKTWKTRREPDMLKVHWKTPMEVGICWLLFFQETQMDTKEDNLFWDSPILRQSRRCDLLPLCSVSRRSVGHDLDAVVEAHVALFGGYGLTRPTDSPTLLKLRMQPSKPQNIGVVLVGSRRW